MSDEAGENPLPSADGGSPWWHDVVPPPDPNSYSRGGQLFLGLVGLGVVLGGVLMWYFPGTHTVAAPSNATCPDAAGCVVEVQSAPETLVTTLAVFGIFILLIAFNGRRFTKLSAPGFDVEAAPAVIGAAREQAAAVTRAKAHEARLDDDQAAHAVDFAKALASYDVVSAQYGRGRALLKPTDVTQLASKAADESISQVQGLFSDG